MNHYYKATADKKQAAQKTGGAKADGAQSSPTLDSGGESPERTATTKQRPRETSGSSSRGAALANN